MHYLVTHAIPDAVAAVVAPIAVLVYLFIVDWRLALILFIPIVIYMVMTWIDGDTRAVRRSPRHPVDRADEQ